MASRLDLDAGASDCGTAAPPAAVDAGTCLPGPGIDYPVGPGQRYASIGAVPMERLAPGDTIRIYWRAEPYAEKMMIGALGGTSALPVKVCGVRGPGGELPIIEGKGATTRKELLGFFPYDGHQQRGLIIVGHPHSASSYTSTPTSVTIEGLDIRGAAPPNTFTDASGRVLAYSAPAAGIFVERATGLVIRGCDIHENNNGIYGGTGGGTEATVDLSIVGNHIHDNGSLGDYYEHNTYIEGIAGPGGGTTYAENRYGPVRGGNGAGLKDRGVIAAIRYNWFEGGAHILDLVDMQEAMTTTSTQASFHTTRVFGNVFIRATPAGSMIHYGGDSGPQFYANYRKGTLLFWNNTVIVQNLGYRDWTRTAIFELSTNDENLKSMNNVYFSSIAPTSSRPIGMLGARDNYTSGIASFAGDWASTGWTATDIIAGSATIDRSVVTGLGALTRGGDPGFDSIATGDYTVALSTQPQPVSLAPEATPVLQYVKHQTTKARAGAGIGALVR